jgi:hypothetical protein
VVRCQFQNPLVLGVGVFEIGRVDVARTDPLRFQRDPPVTALLAVFFQHKLAVVAAVEVGHLRERLLETIEEVQHRFPIRG